MNSIIVFVFHISKNYFVYIELEIIVNNSSNRIAIYYTYIPIYTYKYI